MDRERDGEGRAVTVWEERRRSGLGTAARRDPEGGSEVGGGGGGERERVRALGFATQGESGVVCGGWVRGLGARATVGSTSIQRCLMHDPREMAMAQSECSTRV